MRDRDREIRRGRIVAMVGILVAAAPTVLEGSVVGAAVVGLASIVVYYAGASTAIAASLPRH